MTSGFSGKRRKTIRKVAEGARARDMDRIVDRVIAALETRSGGFEERLLSKASRSRLGAARVKAHWRGVPDRLHRGMTHEGDQGAEEAARFDPMNFDAAARFESEVAEFARATADLADERRATVAAVAEMSARGDRIDRLQTENRAALNHLLAY